jgi:hypothetical protein
VVKRRGSPPILGITSSGSGVANSTAPDEFAYTRVVLGNAAAVAGCWVRDLVSVMVVVDEPEQAHVTPPTSRAINTPLTSWILTGHLDYAQLAVLRPHHVLSPCDRPPTGSLRPATPPMQGMPLESDHSTQGLR